MVLEYFYDDYKRSEGSSEVRGIKKDKMDAYKTILKMEYSKNIEEWEHKDTKKYGELFKKLDSIKNISDTFLGKWAEAREEYLGDPEFGSMFSTGYRFSVQEVDFE